MYKDDKDIKIKCPSCDCEYLPGEIYIPKYIIGAPRDVERDIAGNILGYDGLVPDLDETFVCEKCGKTFKVHAQMTFTAEVDTKRDFSKTYSEPLYKEDRIYLEEN